MIAGIFPVPAIFRDVADPQATIANGSAILTAIDVRAVVKRTLTASLC